MGFLQPAFSLVTKVHFLQMTIFAFSLSALAKIREIASHGRDVSEGLFCY